MHPYFIRSTIFNLCFYVLTGVSCIILLPTLFLPRNAFLAVVHGFVYTASFLEKYILGLTYEVRGLEHLPKEGSYIVAAKHQSAYETLKLHILFNDPAVVLKKELLKIPLWGKYLEKSDVIAIDRSTPKQAIKSIQDGAKHVAEQGRPIIIFPQGTRVAIDVTTEQRPYKIGVVRIQEATQLPIIPMALNTGVFYPRHKWCKKPGRIVFEFLPPITPNKDASSVLSRIQMSVEEASSKLMQEAQNTTKKSSRPLRAFIFAIILLAAGYSANWYIAAELTKKSVHNFMDDLKANPRLIGFEKTDFEIAGFPFEIELSLPQQIFTTKFEEMAIEHIRAKSWPLMGMPIEVETGAIMIAQSHWNAPLFFETLQTTITFKNQVLTIIKGLLVSDATQGQASGKVDFNAHPYPKIDLDIALKNPSPFIKDMIEKNIVKEKPALIASAALRALQKRDRTIRSTLTSDKNKIYLGPLKIMELKPVPDQ